MQLAIIDDAVIYIYALSLLFYFSNCFYRNPGAKRMGAGLLACSLLLMLVIFGVRIAQEGLSAFFSTYDYLQLVALCLMAASIVLTFLPRSELAVMLISLIGFIGLLASRLGSSEGQEAYLHGYVLHSLLTLHIVLAGVSFAALTMAAVLAILYLFLHHRLKVKKWGDIMRRLPSLESLDSYIPAAVLWGVSLLAVSLLIAGAIIVREGTWGAFLDFKMLLTIGSFVVYLLYFAIRRHKRSTGVSMAKWVLLGYAVIIVSFLSNSFSAFHSWNWR
ncbi:cytochrome c biogenesis protein CcsA [Paenibacillus pinistramenti]|uniref:cytochrome c biogenesis protein CcsA n=1 Tax=Paenibacillus pinistramenti TaxID=1768003 RepID=UPI001EEFBFF2|nr:cytochrome c biogenesis protein CcsA [Paenibacillus pinistramenti]